MRAPRRLVPVLLLPLALAACKPPTSPSESTSAPTPTAPSPAPVQPGGMKVALLTPGPVSDAGWNASAYQGLQEVGKQLGAQVRHQQTKGPAEFEAAFRSFGSQGYNLVFAHGNEYGSAALKVAKDFPRTTFVISSGGVTAPNVVSLVFDLGQATYLCGEIGALMSRTGKIACVGGIELPSVKGTFVSFKDGASHAKPGVKVTEVYTNSFEDQSAGKQATAALITAGNDFIIHNADQAGLGVIKTVQENKARGIYAFGTNSNQNSLAPDVVLASATLDVPRAFLEVAGEVKAGTSRGGKRIIGMKDGGIDLVYNPALKSKIPAGVLKRVEADKHAIIEGTLHVAHGAL